jgi:hypothetical protein
MKKNKIDAERGSYNGGREERRSAYRLWVENHHLEDLDTDGRTLVKYNVYLRNKLFSSIDLSLFSDTLPA